MLFQDSYAEYGPCLNMYAPTILRLTFCTLFCYIMSLQVGVTLKIIPYCMRWC